MRSNNSKAQEPVFNELIFSIPVALICTHIIMGFKEEKDNLSGFLLRSLLAFVAFLFVKYITRYLDVNRPWHAGVWMRFFLQFIYGFIGVAFFDFVVCLGYLEILDVHISNTSYFDQYSLPICIYIAMVNIYYNYGYFVGLKMGNTINAKKSENPGLPLEHESDDLVRYSKQRNVVYISISKKVHFAKNTSGESVFWYHTLEESISKLPAGQFHQLDRAHIVHREIIEKIISEPQHKKLTVRLKSPFSEEIHIPVDRIAGFKQWWLAGKEGANPS